MIRIRSFRASIIPAIACLLASCSSALDVDTPRSKEYENPISTQPQVGTARSRSITFTAEEDGRQWDGIPSGTPTATIDTASPTPRVWIKGIDLSAITATAVTRVRFRCDSLMADGTSHPIAGDPDNGAGMGFEVLSNSVTTPTITKIADATNTVSATLTHVAGTRRITADIVATLQDVPGSGMTTPFHLVLTIDY